MSDEPRQIPHDSLPEQVRQEIEYHEKRMKPLVGATIIEATIALDEWGDSWEVWPRLVVRLTDGREIALEISRDPEGNGPGFIESKGLGG